MISGHQIRAARALLDWTREKLGEQCRLSIETIKKIETGASDPKQQTIDYMKSAGEIAAGATVFVGGATYSKAVAFVTGIVTTEVEKRLLWDILLHAKNLEARSLKDLEEVAPISAIHRLVFFPKRGLPGMVDGFPVGVILSG